MDGSTNAQTLDAPFIRVQTQTANLTANTLTTVKYADARVNTDFFSYDTTTGVITVKKSGAYLITMSIAGQITNAGIIQIGFKYNSSSQYFYAHHYQEETLNNFTYQATKIDQLSANDTVTPEAHCSQNFLTNAQGRASFFTMIYLGRSNP